MSGGGSTGGQGSAGGSDPFEGLGTPGSGGMTAAERRAALDARLEAGYAVFDGVILSERERAQGQANEAGAAVMGTGGDSGDGDASDGGGVESGQGGATVIASAPNNSSGGGYLPAGTAGGREGEFSSQNQPSFPPPADIPSGDDDDVVARQLREAALHEPDPELREKLWNEYRKYTGLAQ
jgi:hypothetical protein